MWINVAPLEVIQQAYELILRSPTCLVDDILDLGCHSCVVHHHDQPTLVVVNMVGLPRTALLTFLSFPRFHELKIWDPRMIWDSHSSNIEKQNVNEKKQATKFPLRPHLCKGISKGTFWWILGQVMDLNCLTWIFNLILVK